MSKLGEDRGTRASIQVEQTSHTQPMVFNVAVTDDTGHSRHRVSLQHGLYDRIKGRNAATPTQCVEAAFRFLLERESRSEILPSFDLNVIFLYFPDFEEMLPRFLDPA